MSTMRTPMAFTRSPCVCKTMQVFTMGLYVPTSFKLSNRMGISSYYLNLEPL